MLWNEIKRPEKLISTAGLSLGMSTGKDWSDWRRGSSASCITKYETGELAQSDSGFATFSYFDTSVGWWDTFEAAVPALPRLAMWGK